MMCKKKYMIGSKAIIWVGLLLCLLLLSPSLQAESLDLSTLSTEEYGQAESAVLTPTVEGNLVKLTWVPNSLAPQVPGDLQIWSNDSSIWI